MFFFDNRSSSTSCESLIHRVMSSAIYLLLLYFSTWALADNGTTWIFPPGPTNPNGATGSSSGVTVAYGDTVEIQWTSTYPSSAQSQLKMALLCGTGNIMRAFCLCLLASTVALLTMFLVQHGSIKRVPMIHYRSLSIISISPIGPFR